MKTSIDRSLVGFGLFLSLALFAFNLRPGAHSFQVFVDDKLVTERYVKMDMKAPVIQLATSSKKVDLRYNECGRTVSGRKLTIKDEKDKILKTWSFDGSTSGLEDAMSLQVKELESFAGFRDEGLRIYYTSNDFSEGIHVLTLVKGGEVVALN